jgi:hypothetical protein
MSELDQSTTPRRFILNNERNIIDVCHPETMVPSYMNYSRRATSGEELDVEYDDDLHLREVVLKARLRNVAGKLLNRPEKGGSLESLLWAIIVASQLNRRVVPTSAGRDAKRKVKRKKSSISADCSISLFIHDVERLLTDLYGDVQGEDFRALMLAVKGTVIKVSRGLDPDLWREYQQAGRMSCGVLGQELKAGEALMKRAREAIAHPTNYGQYTVQFAKAFKQQWPRLKQLSTFAAAICGPATGQ